MVSHIKSLSKLILSEWLVTMHRSDILACVYELTVEATYSFCIGKKKKKAFSDNNGFIWAIQKSPAPEFQSILPHVHISVISQRNIFPCDYEL